MATEPPNPRAVAFFDGQNLFHSAKAAFGYSYPNYDPVALAQSICALKGWRSAGVRFYTGVPDASDHPFWNHFWIAKGAQMGRQGVHVYTRPLRYRNKSVRLPDGTNHTFLDGDEKGIDVRIALDVIRLATQNAYDVALLFCRDQDLSEVAEEIKLLAGTQRRWIKMASHIALPCVTGGALIGLTGSRSIALRTTRALTRATIARSRRCRPRLGLRQFPATQNDRPLSRRAQGLA